MTFGNRSVAKRDSVRSVDSFKSRRMDWLHNHWVAGVHLFLCNSRGWDQSIALIVSLEIHLICLYCPTRKINYKLFNFLFSSFWCSFIFAHRRSHSNKAENFTWIEKFEMSLLHWKWHDVPKNCQLIKIIHSWFSLGSLNWICAIAFDTRLQSRSSCRFNGANQWKSISFCPIVCVLCPMA